VTVADYIFAVIGILLSLVVGGAGMVGLFAAGMSSGFGVEDESLARTSGCLMAAGALGFIWFVGVLTSGSWGWLG
jgi:hypothetical protein